MCIFFLFLHIYMYLAPYVPGKGSPSRPTFRSRLTLRSPNPSSVRITVARRRDVSPNRDPNAAAMEGQAPDATVMEDQPPDAMAGPSLPLAVAAEGQAAASHAHSRRPGHDGRPRPARADCSRAGSGR